MADYRPVIEKWGQPIGSGSLTAVQTEMMLDAIAELAGCGEDGWQSESSNYNDKLSWACNNATRFLNYLEKADIHAILDEAVLIEYGDPNDEGDEPNLYEAALSNLQEAVPELRTMIDKGDVLRFYIDD